ncbi:alkene reductase [Streptomyces sp. NPDC002088]|uniref:alkene reductase n=1 Tax=Streptomyces sp. NPDC002088 TaxID=3154665 RepID=UPI003327A6E2
MNTTLFDSMTLGALTVPNRIAMAPMTRSRAAADGTPTQLMSTYYAQRATAGLIIAEGTHPTAAGRIGPGAPGLHQDAHRLGWSCVADAVHDAGGRIFVQLMHAGRLAHPSFLPRGLHPVAPSAIAARAEVYTAGGRKAAVRPQALTHEQILHIIDDFARSAARAMAAGLDGVEIHAANGYLLHQFLAENANLRTDDWGGSPEARIRLTVEVVRAVAAAIGPHRVGLRISPSNQFGDLAEQDPDTTYTALVQELSQDNLAYLHLVETGRADLDDRIRAVWPSALVVTPTVSRPGDVTKAGAANAWLRRGADLIAFGRGFLANPDFVERLRVGAPFNAPAPHGLYGGDHRGYTDYPTLQRLPAVHP